MLIEQDTYLYNKFTTRHRDETALEARIGTWLISELSRALPEY